ncbi:MAG: hypothetical protein HKO81_05185 [Flavobacteriaceae bacterium]|nr:hypothetical protein [Flavobacteriaceae bacterium]
MKIKRILRLLALVIMIAMASILPVPITFFNKDKLPKFVIEQIDQKEEDSEKEDIKEIF